MYSGAGWGPAFAVLLILAAMFVAKSTRPVDEQTAEIAAVEATGSIAR